MRASTWPMLVAIAGAAVFPFHAAAQENAPEPVVVTPVSASGAVVSLKLDADFQSIKYVVFFTRGSSQLGSTGMKTVKLLLPSAKSASEVIVTGRADPMGDKQANIKLSLRRAQALAMALQAGGATRPQYHIVSDTSLRDIILPQDVKALWQPTSMHALLRRSMVDVRTAQQPDIAEAPAVLQIDRVPVASKLLATESQR